MAATDAALEMLACRLGEALTARGATVATAESCTGGWIAKVITDVPGSSRWFGAGFITYSNEAKSAMLSVPAATIERHGAVSEAVVVALAEQARQRAAADFAVAVSGVAGPDGGTPEKPVGTVWLGWASERGTTTRRCHFEGDRDTVRRQSVACALHGLLTLAT